jgi:hypothetical protein
LSSNSRQTGTALSTLTGGTAQASFAHLLWIRLLARRLRPVNPLDFKEHFYAAQKCGIGSHRRTTAHPAGVDGHVDIQLPAKKTRLQARSDLTRSPLAMPAAA